RVAAPGAGDPAGGAVPPASTPPQSAGPVAAPLARAQGYRATVEPIHRFRRNLLLLVQLLALLLLVAAFARPFFDRDASGFRSLVIVIADSASMGATDGAPTRLDQARARAADLVASLSPSDEVMVVVAGTPTSVAAPFTRDHAAALRALDEIRLHETAGTL